jgi:hypothetical protein
VQSDRRSVAVGLVFTLVILLAIAAFLNRPATVIGVDDDALARSLGADSDYSKCTEIAGGRWKCELSQGSDSEVVTVQTKRFGCWKVIERGQRSAFLAPKSGCIDAFDAFVNL